MATRRRASWSTGPRLPLGPRREPQPGCLLAGVPGLTHDDPIRFDLHRYGRKVGVAQMCGSCFRAFAQLAPADPLTLGA